MDKQQCIRRSATCWAQRADTQVDWPNSFWDMTKCLKPYFCKLKKQQCIPRSATCWAQRIDTHVDWPNSFWDMTKCLKHYFCKLKKRQCIRRSATCWAQRVDTQVDWPNSCWDMTKCLKTLFLQIGQTTVYSAPRYLLSTTRWHTGRLAQQLLRYDKMFKNLIFANWTNNSVFGAALPAEHNALTLRSIGPIVSEIWQNV